MTTLIITPKLIFLFLLRFDFSLCLNVSGCSSVGVVTRVMGIMVVGLLMIVLCRRIFICSGGVM